jgi:hypothetical protein
MSGRKTAMAYFRRTKRIPAAARISRSLSTGMR